MIRMTMINSFDAAKWIFLSRIQNDSYGPMNDKILSLSFTQTLFDNNLIAEMVIL